MPPNVRPKKRASAITSSRECEEFFHTVPEFERMLVRSGIILIKYWFSITDQEQNLQVPCQEVHHDPITLPDPTSLTTHAILFRRNCTCQRGTDPSRDSRTVAKTTNTGLVKRTFCV